VEPDFREFLQWLTSKKVFALVVVIGGPLAVLGVLLYATSPGVASYNASWLLVAPLLFAVLWWMYERVPVWFAWSAAAALALIGPVGYLIVGGAQWWNWGQLAPVPLAVLIAARGIKQDQGEGGTPYGGYVDGPWGPP
jgi:hypothetical protein